MLPGDSSPIAAPPPKVGRTVKVWAAPTFLGGRELLTSEAIVSDRKARWRVRQIGISDIDTNWILIDDADSSWKITAITEPPGQRGVWFDLHTEATE